MNKIEEIKKYFLELPEVKRVKELENYIDNNKDINNKLLEIKKIKKKMVNAKEFNQPNMYKEYEMKYKKLHAELLDLPFVEEYLELLDIINNLLQEFTNSIEFKLNKIINV